MHILLIGLISIKSTCYIQDQNFYFIFFYYKNCKIFVIWWFRLAKKWSRPEGLFEIRIGSIPVIFFFREGGMGKTANISKTIRNREKLHRSTLVSNFISINFDDDDFFPMTQRFWDISEKPKSGTFPPPSHLRGGSVARTWDF